MEWTKPIIDRTLEDCVFGNPKGSITADVLNRIESNIGILASSVGILIDTKTNWTRQLYYRTADLNRIKNNLIVLVDTTETELSNEQRNFLYPAIEEEFQTYEMYNILESIILAISKNVIILTTSILHTGMFYIGGSIDDQLFDEVNI